MNDSQRRVIADAPYTPTGSSFVPGERVRFQANGHLRAGYVIRQDGDTVTIDEDRTVTPWQVCTSLVTRIPS